ncbi:uncharacterized protein LOC123878027 [Maniola jurtina]|uniref:uncharacterized protein LOC123878027 n=1 Tax=Maniola jurtina TaxID=191418 RepID=UPI001E68B512|nr:uncharacterized protein LOC123878027 [Maniola jurtina]
MSSKTFLEISFFITLLVLAQQNTEATKRDSSNLLSLLTNRQHQHKQPLIIVLGRDTAVKNRARVDQVSSSDTSDEDVYLVHHLLGYDQNKGIQHHVKNKKSTKKPHQREEKKRQRFRLQGIREEDRDKTVLRSPIVKKLLRISNSLRCAAKNECQDKCTSKKNVVFELTKCQFQCDVKYDCDEEKEEIEEEKDDCEDDKYGSCNGSNEQGEMSGSTKGVKIEFGQLRS